MKVNNIEELINKRMKFIIKHLDECKKGECDTCRIFYIKLDVYEELYFEITKQVN